METPSVIQWSKSVAWNVSGYLSKLTYTPALHYSGSDVSPLKYMCIVDSDIATGVDYNYPINHLRNFDYPRFEYEGGFRETGLS